MLCTQRLATFYQERTRARTRQRPATEDPTPPRPSPPLASCAASTQKTSLEPKLRLYVFTDDHVTLNSMPLGSAAATSKLKGADRVAGDTPGEPSGGVRGGRRRRDGGGEARAQGGRGAHQVVPQAHGDRFQVCAGVFA